MQQVGEVLQTLTSNFTRRSCGKCPDCGRQLSEIRISIPGRQDIVGTAACECVQEREEQERQARYEQERKKHIRALFSASQLGPRFEACTFANWRTTIGAENVYQEAKSYVANWEQRLRDGEGLLFCGTPGNGKSHLAAAIVNDLLPKGVAAIFANVPDLLGRLRRTFSNSGESEAKIMRALVEADLLVLDDLGAQKSSDRTKVGWAEETIYQIVNSRYNSKLPLIVTTNQLPSDLEESIGIRSQSRLVEMCVMVANKAPSFRNQVARARSQRGREQV